MLHTHKILSAIAVATMLVVAWACAPSRPAGVLSKDDMEDVLYDMYVAQKMYDERMAGMEGDADIVSLRLAVLQKHGLTQEEWDSSFVYYSRNARELMDVYRSMNERLEDNIVALGGKIDGVMGEEADTANIWKGESSFLLAHQVPYNIYPFEVEPDSTVNDGDRLTLQYDVKFIFQDGNRDVACFLAVYYDNDSVATQTTRSYFDGHGILTVNNDVDRLHVRKIKGYFMLVKNLTQTTSDANQSTMRLASISNVKLLHLPTLPPAKPGDSAAKADSLRRDSLHRDSLMQEPLEQQEAPQPELARPVGPEAKSGPSASAASAPRAPRREQQRTK